MIRFERYGTWFLCFLLVVVDSTPSAGQTGQPLPQALVRSLTEKQKSRLKEAAKLDQQLIELRKQGKAREAIAVAKEAVAARREVLGTEHSETAGALNNLAIVQQSSGELAAARTTFEETLKIRQKVLGVQHADTAITLYSLALVMESLGDLSAAKASFEQALPIQRKLLGEEHPQTVMTRYRLGLALQSLGDNAAARPVLEQTLKTGKKVFGGEDFQTATLLNQLGIASSALGKKDEARSYFEKSLRIRQKVQGEEHVDTVATMTRLGLVLKDQRDFAAARPLLENALKTQTKLSGEESPATATALSNLGSLLRAQGDNAAAKKPYERSVEIRKKALGAEHLETADAIFDLGNVLSAQGDSSGALRCYEQALDIRKQLLGEEHSETMEVLFGLASLRFSQGDAAGAKALYERVLEFRKRTAGPEHPLTASTLNSLGTVHKSLGDYAAARSALEQAVSIRKKALGPEHLLTADSLGRLGSVLERQGDYATARQHMEQALQIQRKSLGNEHHDVAVQLNNLAGVLESQRDYAAARTNYEESLRIRRKLHEDDRSSIATTLNNIGVLLFHQGDLAGAQPYYDESLAIRKKVLGDDHPDTGASLNNLGALLRALGDNDQARPYLVEALKISRAILGDQHPTTTRSFINLAVLETAAEQWSAATEYFDGARRGVRRHIARVLPALSEREQTLFLREMDQGDFHRALSFALLRRDDQQIAATSAGWVLNGKGVAQTALAERTLIARDQKDPALAVAVRELLDVRRRLASLVMTASSGGPDSGRREQIGELTRQEEQLARQLTESAGRTSVSDPWIELDDFRKRLPPASVAIEIARFDVRSFKALESGNGIEPARYAAWVIPPVGDVRIVDLGPADAIDAAVEQARKSVGEVGIHGDDLKALGEAALEQRTAVDLQVVAGLVWKPLSEKIGDSRQIFLSPDASLWLVPWAALPVAKDRYLIEDLTLTYLISGRDLLAESHSKVATSPPVVVANPDFDLAADKVRAAIKAALPNLPLPVGSEAILLNARNSLPRVIRLPGTAAEAQFIRPSIEKYAGKAPVVYTDDQALETVFKSVARPNLAVLSTHGFFLPDQQVQNEDGATPKGARAVALAVDGKPVENPLLRCGLLLAGCNRPQSAAVDDGILTGLEIVGIDLRGTRLVVLSACETGIGQVRNGEGVAGLRQAFQLAGAQSVVATLWQVPDRDSTLLMNDFFAGLVAGMSKSEALRDSQLKRIASRRERFGGAHPYFWAAWTLTGN